MKSLDVFHRIWPTVEQDILQCGKTIQLDSHWKSDHLEEEQLLSLVHQ